MARVNSRIKGEILERQIQAFELRKQGFSIRAIADRLKVSVGTAFNDIQDELNRLAELKAENAEEVRTLELERIDMLIKGLSPMAMVGNVGAVTAYLKCLERRAKLLGLDAPTKTALTNPDGTEPFQLEIKTIDYRNAISPPATRGSVSDSD